QAIDLGPLDLGVPIGALHQPYHEAVSAAPRQVQQEVDDLGTTLLVGLDRQPYPVPAGQHGVEAKLFYQAQREVQAVGLFGIDVYADVIVSCQDGQMLQAGIEFDHDAVELGTAVAGMKRRQFDGDAGRIVGVAVVRVMADRVHRLPVGVHGGRQRV